LSYQEEEKNFTNIYIILIITRMGRSRSSSSGSSSGGSKRFFGSSNSSSASKPAQTRTAQPTHAQPPAVQHAPPPQHQQPQAPMGAAPSSGGGMFSGLGATLVQGMAFGGGSAIAHRVVDGIAGPRTMQVEHVNSNSSPDVANASNSLLTSSPNAVDSASASKSTQNSLTCGEEVQQFQQCMTSNNNDFNKCQFMFDALSSCQRAAKENARW
jgi:hypothetical protein